MSAERVLEFPRVLAEVETHCETTLGAEAALSLKASFDREIIELRVRRTAQALKLLNEAAQPVYSNARDVLRPVNEAAKGSVLPGEQLFRISETLNAMARMRKHLLSQKTNAQDLVPFAERMPNAPDLEQALGAISPEGTVRDDATPALKTIRAQKATQQKRTLERVQSLVTTLKSYLQEPLYTQRSGRYVLPVKAQYKGKVPGLVHDSSGSGQTLFIEPEAVVGDMNKLREIEGKENEEVERILRELSEKVGDHSEDILGGLEALTEVDVIFACARYAADRRAPAPVIRSGHFLRIDSGHHPLISIDESVPVSICVGGACKSLLITGPNTGGKTVTLKLLGLYSMMIGCGMFPPAQTVEYGPFTGVFADIGDEQSLEQSLSTFSGHVKNIAAVFKDAGKGALALLDEIGSGTDPREGAALGKSVLSTLIERGVTVAASTHFGELKQFALDHEGTVTAAMEFDLETLRPTYHLIPGAAGASHALDIARRYGIPEGVVANAENSLGEEAAEERGKSKELDRLIREAREEKLAAEQLRTSVSEERKALGLEREVMREKLSKTRSKVDDALAEAIRESRERYRELLERVKELSGREREDVLREAKAVEAELSEAREAIVEPAVKTDPITEIRAGMPVRVRGQAGKVLDVQKSGKVEVQVGALKMVVKPEDLSVAEAPVEKPRPARRSQAPSKAETVSSELTLRKMRAEEAIEVLDRFLDDAALAGLTHARIIHGKGTGVLREVVRDVLRRRKDVENFEDAPLTAGGSGVTVVRFS